MSPTNHAGNHSGVGSGDIVAEKIATLTAYDLGTGYVRIVGTATVDGADQDIEYDAPRFLIDALVSAARTQGALT